MSNVAISSGSSNKWLYNSEEDVDEELLSLGASAISPCSSVIKGLDRDQN